MAQAKRIIINASSPEGIAASLNEWIEAGNPINHVEFYADHTMFDFLEMRINYSDTSTPLDLRDAREIARVSIEDAASLIGLTETIYVLHEGGGKFTQEQTDILAQAFGICKVDAFLFNTKKRGNKDQWDTKQ